MFGDDPKASPDLARIVSERHAERLKTLLDDKPGKVRPHPHSHRHMVHLASCSIAHVHRLLILHALQRH